MGKYAFGHLTLAHDDLERLIAVLLCAQHNHASESRGVEEAQGEMRIRLQ